MKKAVCCDRNCCKLGLRKCDRKSKLTLSDCGVAISIVIAPEENVQVLKPDLCDILTQNGDKISACDFFVRRQKPSAGIYLEFKAGAWSFSKVKAQFEGGMQIVSALKLKVDDSKFYVVADQGPSGGTQAIGGLMTIHGKPIRHAKRELHWT